VDPGKVQHSGDLANAVIRRDDIFKAEWLPVRHMASKTISPGDRRRAAEGAGAFVAGGWCSGAAAVVWLTEARIELSKFAPEAPPVRSLRLRVVRKLAHRCSARLLAPAARRLTARPRPSCPARRRRHRLAERVKHVDRDRAITDDPDVLRRTGRAEWIG
jgi:hypothetical protein